MKTPFRPSCGKPHAFPAVQRFAVPFQDELKLRVDYSNPHVAVISVAGIVDDASLPRLAELVQQRLAGAIDVLVINLSDVEFLSVSGLELLRNSSTRGQAREIDVCLVAPGHAVRRALRVTGVEDDLECYDSLDGALSESRRAHHRHSRAREAFVPKTASALSTNQDLDRNISRKETSS